MNTFKLRPTGRGLVRLYLMAAAASIGTALATPQFARQTRLPCSSCHTQIPRLNAFGQRFYANGFRLPGHKTQSTSPYWIELSAAGSTVDGSKAIPIAWDNTTLASDGALGGYGGLYLAQFGPVTHDFELFAAQPFTKHFAVQMGKVPGLSQIDPGLALSLSTPAFLAPIDLSGIADVGPFGPADAVVAARIVASSGSAMPYGDGWKLAATVPFTTGDGEAATEGLSSSPKGAFVEAYRRSGMDSLGVNAFFGRDGRHYYGLLAEKKLGKFYLEGGASNYDWSGQSGNAASAGVEWTPTFDKAFGFRVDSMQGQISYVPFLSFVLGGKQTAFRFAVESQFQAGARPMPAFEATFRF